MLVVLVVVLEDKALELLVENIVEVMLTAVEAVAVIMAAEVLEDIMQWLEIVTGKQNLKMNIIIKIYKEHLNTKDSLWKIYFS